MSPSVITSTYLRPMRAFPEGTSREMATPRSPTRTANSSPAGCWSSNGDAETGGSSISRLKKGALGKNLRSRNRPKRVPPNAAQAMPSEIGNWAISRELRGIRKVCVASTIESTIDPEIKNMVWQIAKEKAEIKRLEREVEAQSAGLTKKHEELLTLRNHLKSGETVYVATNGKAYTNVRVEEDLRHRFSMFQTAEKTKEKSEQILDLRRKSLEQALAKLEQAQVHQRELEIELENLNARQRMVSVAKTASNINIDDSQLARTKSMIDEISAKIDAEEEMLNLAPKYLGEIPVSEGDVSAQGDIAAEIDAYFGGDSHGEEPQAEIADGKLVKNDK